MRPAKRPLVDRLDPELAAALATMPTSTLGSTDVAGIPEARASIHAAMENGPAPPPDVVLSKHTIRAPDDGAEIALAVRTPKAHPDGLPCVLWMHGGGYVIGSAFHPAPRLDRWCAELGCVVVSVDYRLAPEHPYPVPLEDCFTALGWTTRHPGEVGIDPQRVVLAGASAGGGLAAGTALLARDRGVAAAPAGVLLIYPMIDDRTAVASPSDGDAPVWSHSANRVGWRAYLGPVLGEQDPGTRVVTPYAAPARATDLTALPPTFIGVGTVDIFCGEDVQFAASLVRAGVSVELHVHPGAHHGFENHAPNAAVTRRFNAEIDDWLRRTIGQ